MIKYSKKSIEELLNVVEKSILSNDYKVYRSTELLEADINGITIKILRKKSDFLWIDTSSFDLKIDYDRISSISLNSNIVGYRKRIKNIWVVLENKENKMQIEREDATIKNMIEKVSTTIGKSYIRDEKLNKILKN
jgi:hypothetical protein